MYIQELLVTSHIGYVRLLMVQCIVPELVYTTVVYYMAWIVVYTIPSYTSLLHIQIHSKHILIININLSYVRIHIQASTILTVLHSYQGKLIYSLEYQYYRCIFFNTYIHMYTIYIHRAGHQYTRHHPPHLYTGRRRRRYTTHARLTTTC